MVERIYKDSNTLVEFNPIRSTITVDVSGCGDCYSFYYWNLSKVLSLFTRRYIQCRDINHGEDFKSLIYPCTLSLVQSKLLSLSSLQ